MKNTVTIGGRELPVPPASLKSIKRWMKAQEETVVNSLEYMNELSVFVGDTLAREDGGTPGLDRDWLDENLDERNVPTVLRAIYSAGRIESGEAETATSASTGTSSTPT
ncbi:hypothetical protein [Burkholderia cenocepacia]|uniref:Uncharacterized protein n=1 Tax=Burkholderia cenocepacia TaxID=95486 RepID=A0A1V2W344_9BURK|nr:hypothetical protein [Burkholderia cenocepacia]MBR8248695.1 hypothetical protein [Burkholderia cenocepacia]MBR8288869.1 hypothetical protein [Burkholderia cenocepacia]MBR8497139.1 hypothetical protein [Burkholderia cenocepacia]ONJ13706.1 hypothetical protein A8D83_12120 [Burkholderia cenocepacia]ONJ30189.1 hypothetical protein A8D90_07090 [Burkholderia cenocepacia]